MQTSLFDEIVNPRTSEENRQLIITASVKTLSKAQKDFNRLTKKVEKLRLLLDDKKRLLDKCLGYYSESVFPLERKMLDGQIRLIKLINRQLEMKIKLPAKDKGMLVSFMNGLMDDIIFFLGKNLMKS